MMEQLRLSYHYDKSHGGPSNRAIVIQRMSAPWSLSAVHLEVDGSHGATHLSLESTIRLRDYLSEVIENAGERPLHPMLGAGMEKQYSGEVLYGPNDVKKISDALYERDELKEKVNGVN